MRRPQRLGLLVCPVRGRDPGPAEGLAGLLQGGESRCSSWGSTTATPVPTRPGRSCGPTRSPTPRLADNGGRTLLALRGKAANTPTTLVLDQQGRLAARVAGAGLPRHARRPRRRRARRRRVSAGAGTTIEAGALPLALVLALAAGFVSFASPCVLPLVPGFLGYVTGLSDVALEKRGRGRLLLGRPALRARFQPGLRRGLGDRLGPGRAAAGAPGAADAPRGSGRDRPGAGVPRARRPADLAALVAARRRPGRCAAARGRLRPRDVALHRARRSRRSSP